MVAVTKAGAAGTNRRDSEAQDRNLPPPATIEIRLNGEPRRVPVGTTVAGLLRLLEIQGDRVAVELDRTIVRRPDWEATAIGPEAGVELVHFVGGG